MAHAIDEMLGDMVATLVREVDPERVYLFGSHARGDAHDQSDIDLLVVERTDFGPQRSRRDEMVRLARLLGGFPVAKDILVYSVAEFEHGRTGRNNVVARAVREGRLLYDRP